MQRRSNAPSSPSVIGGRVRNAWARLVGGHLPSWPLRWARPPLSAIWRVKSPVSPGVNVAISSLKGWLREILTAAACCCGRAIHNPTGSLAAHCVSRWQRTRPSHVWSQAQTPRFPTYLIGLVVYWSAGSSPAQFIGTGLLTSMATVAELAERSPPRKKVTRDRSLSHLSVVRTRIKAHRMPIAE